MKQVSLNGSWTLRKGDEQQSIPARVPGCVHTDLLAAGLIDDPFFRDNEAHLFWIGETDWTYQRTFEVSADLLKHDRVLLRCHGLDTLATITVNGSQIAQTDNMYRTYEVDLKAHLTAGENMITIRFSAPVPYLRQQEAEKGMMYAWSIGEHRLNSGAWLRKEPSNFGWDWGPMLVTSGIWRDIELIAYDTARLNDVLVLQSHSENAVALTVQLGVETQNDPVALTAEISVSHNEQTVASATATFENGLQTAAELVIHDPHLWWPNGMGDQPLYTVDVRLYDAERRVLDTQTKRIGLRTLVLERNQDQWGESFQFAANGVSFFAKGANWIPADTFPSRLTRADYEHLLTSATEAHMNMLRVWGGGLYEADEFYDLCDEYGICVWQDFIFACGTYPTYDAGFMANVKAEAEDNVRRIRHHPSLALWCGNNELEQGLVGPEWTPTTMSWDDYSKLFDVLLRDVVAACDSQRDYWPGSPHSPHGDRHDWRNPAWGDMHNWEVWHQKQPFEHYRMTQHRFISEFGLQSFPEPHTTHAFTEPEDRNLTSYVMEYHQRSGIGNSTIAHYMLDWFRMPTSFESLLWLSQILQGLALQIGIEHWRRKMPRTMGTLYWQLNDLWPAPSWSSIDHTGRWKALHYMAKRFYAPVLLSGVEDTDNGAIELHVTADAVEADDGVVFWKLTTIDGEHVESGELKAAIRPHQNTPVGTLDFSAQCETHGVRDLLFWAELRTSKGAISETMLAFARPKHFALRTPEFRVDVRTLAERTAEITLQSDVPALYVWMEVQGQRVNFSDNFFHLRPAHTRTLRAYLSEPLDPDTLIAALTVRSLPDTYRQ